MLSTTLAFVTVPANKPDAPSIRLASPLVGIGPVTNVAGAEVIGDGYAILSVVVVSGAVVSQLPGHENSGSD